MKLSSSKTTNMVTNDGASISRQGYAELTSISSCSCANFTIKAFVRVVLNRGYSYCARRPIRDLHLSLLIKPGKDSKAYSQTKNHFTNYCLFFPKGKRRGRRGDKVKMAKGKKIFFSQSQK